MPGWATPSVVEGVAAVAAVVGLDAADRGDQLPGEVAGWSAELMTVSARW